MSELADDRARRALTAAGVGTWTWYTSTDHIQWSDQVGPLLGRPLGWAPATFAEFLAIVHDDDRTVMLAKLDATLRTATPYDPRYRVRWPDGSWHWLQGGQAWVERGDDGTVCRLDGAVWDVTALEESLRGHTASEQRLALIYASTSDLMFLMAVERGADGRVAWYRCESVNTAYCTASGLHEADLVGRTVEEILNPSEAVVARARYDAVVQTGHATRYDEIAHVAAGRLVLETSLTPIRDATGQVTHLLGTARDVTSLRQAEETIRESEARYRALVDTSPDGIVVHVDGEIRYANAALARLVGMPEATLLIGEPLDTLMLADEGNTLAATFTDAGNAGADWLGERTMLQLDTQAHVRVELSAGLVRFTGGGTTVDAVQTTFRDVSARHRVEAERRALEVRLQHALKLEAVGQLAGGLAHDLNNLLCVVSGNRQLVRTELDAMHPAQVLLDEMETAVDRAQRLLHSLLTFSRRDTILSETLDAAVVVRTFVPLLRTLLGARVTLHIDVPAHGVWLVADRSHLEQILMNLVVNARDALLTDRHGHAGEGGTIRIALRERRLEHDASGASAPLCAGSYCELSVRDDGHGMDDETLSRAIEPFFTTKPVGSGTGLGLATVFGIARQMQGDVRLRSMPGEGTVVTVLLPLATDAPLSGAETTGEAERPDVSPPQAHEVSAVDAPGELHGVTIVLVDDESAVRRLVRRLLERVGATVLEAGNGADGLAVWTTHRDAVTLVVTDVRMPVMDGEALVHLLRVESPGLPVVMMSGYTEQTTVDLATRTAFVRKPFALDVLLKAISGVRA